MLHKTSSVLFALFALFSLMIGVVFLYTPVQAQSISTDKNNCTSCHEDLYFLHDTGNWYCLRESPMSCVNCHDGNPEAIRQETAHLHRAAHPIINEDISKCRECHPAECDERVEVFDQRAGLSQVRVAAPYTPAYSTSSTVSLTANVIHTEEQSDRSPMFWVTISLAVTASLAFIIFIIHHTLRKEHNP